MSQVDEPFSVAGEVHHTVYDRGAEEGGHNEAIADVQTGYASTLETDSIGVNISERKSGTERTKKPKKQELVMLFTANSIQFILSREYIK